LDKLKEIGKVSENALLVTADVPSLYPSIPHEDGLRALHTKLEEREDKTVSSESLISLAEFVLKNNYFEFNSDVYCQISGTACMGTKFAPPYACIFIDCERSLLSAGLDFRACERKGGTADNTSRNEIRVAHTMQNSHWSKSIPLSIKSDM
jgi:hypothetical protein